MSVNNAFDTFLGMQQFKETKPKFWLRMHIDIQLMIAIMIVTAIGFFILYSAGGQGEHLLAKQAIRFGVALLVMYVFAQIPPRKYKLWAPYVFGFGMLLLLTVLIVGHIGKGAQRWLDFGIVRFQPSEIIKIALPMMLAWYLSEHPLPPRLKTLSISAAIIIVPFLLVAKQPDLGTALLILAAGGSVLVLAGMSFSIIIGLFLSLAASIPVVWHFLLHDYQKQRVLTFLYPERDPLGTGYHIIQSKIAIGSGGLFGKGWLNGTQSHLQFLPEHATDFVFALTGEEFGLFGCILLLLLYLFIVVRSLHISVKAQDTFSRLLAGSIALTFFFCVFVNVGMVIGILPVVGIPLPLISYGGSSLVTIMAGFGILMSVHTHRKLLVT